MSNVIAIAKHARTVNASLALRSAKLLIRLNRTSNARVMPLTHSSWKKPLRA